MRFEPRHLFAAGLVGGVLASTAASARFVDNTTYSRLLNAGDGGPVCALYIGYTRVGIRNSDLFHREACFSSVRKCRTWFREVTRRFPDRELARPCARRR